MSTIAMVGIGAQRVADLETAFSTENQARALADSYTRYGLPVPESVTTLITSTVERIKALVDNAVNVEVSSLRDQLEYIDNVVASREEVARQLAEAEAKKAGVEAAKVAAVQPAEPVVEPAP